MWGVRVLACRWHRSIVCNCHPMSCEQFYYCRCRKLAAHQGKQEKESTQSCQKWIYSLSIQFDKVAKKHILCLSCWISLLFLFATASRNWCCDLFRDFISVFLKLWIIDVGTKHRIKTNRKGHTIITLELCVMQPMKISIAWRLSMTIMASYWSNISMIFAVEKHEGMASQTQNRGKPCTRIVKKMFDGMHW